MGIPILREGNNILLEGGFVWILGIRTHCREKEGKYREMGTGTGRGGERGGGWWRGLEMMI